MASPLFRPDGSVEAPQRQTENTGGLPSASTQPVPAHAFQAAEQAFPVAYRIHSMLPQPGHGNVSPDYEPVAVTSTKTMVEYPVREPCPAPSSVAPALPSSTLTTLVRTPIADMPPLFERTRDLLLRHWTRDRARVLNAIELAVSSFEQPVQLAFAELNRLDGIGALRGMDAARRRALEQAEDALATRYGDTSFRRLAHLDPANILTERRFRWARQPR